MSKDVKVSRTLLGALCAALLISLIAVGFLLGRQSGPPLPTISPSPVASAPLAVQQPAEQSLDARLDALDQRIAARQKQIGGQPLISSSSPDSPPTPTPAQSQVPKREGVEAYFRAVDGVVGGSAAIADPQPMAARLLQQAVSGNEREFDALINRTRQARSDLEAVEAPPSCQEHRALLLAQLSDALDLLQEVRAATASGDTAKLSSLAAGAEALQAEAQRLQDLDRSLRAEL